jgi:hypothetical protein
MSNSQIEERNIEKERKKEIRNRSISNVFVESWRNIESWKKPKELMIGNPCQKCGHYNPLSALHCGACGSILLTNL